MSTSVIIVIMVLTILKVVAFSIDLEVMLVLISISNVIFMKAPTSSEQTARRWAPKDR